MPRGTPPRNSATVSLPIPGTDRRCRSGAGAARVDSARTRPPHGPRFARWSARGWLRCSPPRHRPLAPRARAAPPHRPRRRRNRLPRDRCRRARRDWHRGCGVTVAEDVSSPPVFQHRHLHTAGVRADRAQDHLRTAAGGLKMMDQPIAGHRGIGFGASDPDARGPVAAVCLGSQQVIHPRGSGRPHPAAGAEHRLDARPLFGDMQRPVGAEVHHHDDPTAGRSGWRSWKTVVAVTSASRQRGSRDSSLRAGTTTPTLRIAMFPLVLAGLRTRGCSTRPHRPPAARIRAPALLRGAPSRHEPVPTRHGQGGGGRQHIEPEVSLHMLGAHRQAGFLTDAAVHLVTDRVPPVGRASRRRGDRLLGSGPPTYQRLSPSCPGQQGRRHLHHRCRRARPVGGAGRRSHRADGPVAQTLQPRSEVPTESKRYGLGFWLDATGPAAMLEGMDAGVSFHSRHDAGAGLTWTVVSNTTDGAWPIVRHLGELLRW
jgi:hypothetical protein